MDPISSGQLSRGRLPRPSSTLSTLKLSEPKVEVPAVKTQRGPRDTPVSRRQDRPKAILWLLKSCRVEGPQIMRLVGTKPTIIAIRERGHWNSPNLVAQDPVTLGLCSQIDLDAEVKKAAARLERERKEAGIAEPPKAGTLLPTEETTAAPPPEREQPMATTLAQEARDRRSAPDEEEDAPDVDSVFARLKDLKHTTPRGYLSLAPGERQISERSKRPAGRRGESILDFIQRCHERSIFLIDWVVARSRASE